MKKIGIVVLAFACLLCGCTTNMKAGKNFLAEEKYEQAKEMFEKEIQREKHLDKAHYGKGVACFELKEYEGAVENFEKAIHFGVKEDAVFLSFLGAAYMETGRYEQAIKQYKNALADEKITEELKKEVRYNLIIGYEKAADWETAKKELKDYQKDYPEDASLKREADFLETR